MKAYQERKQEQVIVERVVLPPPGQDHRQCKGISMDGGMINIRGKVGRRSNSGLSVTSSNGANGTRSPRKNGHRYIATLGYAVVLGSLEASALALWALAVGKNMSQAADSCLTADGAEWI